MCCFINTLKKEDVRILEDGKPQEISTFQQNLDLPLSIAILLDCSISEMRTLPDEKAAARSFIEAVMRPGKDEAAIVSFTGEVTLEQGFTGNLDRLRRAIDRVEFVPPSGYIGGGVVVGGTPPISDTNQMLAGSTAIWDAVWASSNDLLADSADNTRRTIILLTDGEDTISQMKMHDAIERAQKADALIYAIGIGDSYQGGVDTGALQKITEQTGGRAYFPRNESELRKAFAQIQQDLREQYLIAYSPSNKARTGSYRKIEIEVIDPEWRKQKLKLNYRPGYFAKTRMFVRRRKVEPTPKYPAWNRIVPKKPPNPTELSHDKLRPTLLYCPQRLVSAASPELCLSPGFLRILRGPIVFHALAVGAPARPARPGPRPWSWPVLKLANR